MLGVGISTTALAVREWHGPFTPARMFSGGEQGAWYDPSDLSTLWQDTAGTVAVTTAGQSVARMDDKSGRGRNATQATLAKRPTYQVDANGKPYLYFDGTDDSMVIGSLATVAVGDMVTALLASNGTTTDPQFMVLSNGGTASPWLSVAQDAGTAAPHSGVGTPTHKVNRTAIITDTRDGLENDLRSLTAPKILTVNNADFTGLTGAELSGYPTSGWPMMGRIYGVVIHEGLSAQQLADTESWLAAKAGVTL